jgi:uncharacterized protein with GYD domain
MSKYHISFTYSSGSWARLIDRPDDRTKVAQKVVESLGGTLECIYWRMDGEDGLAITDFPDSVAVSALETATFKTGAFKSTAVNELLTKQQLRERLILARDATHVYEVPGQQS